MVRVYLFSLSSSRNHQIFKYLHSIVCRTGTAHAIAKKRRIAFWHFPHTAQSTHTHTTDARALGIQFIFVNGEACTRRWWIRHCDVVCLWSKCLAAFWLYPIRLCTVSVFVAVHDQKISKRRYMKSRMEKPNCPGWKVDTFTSSHLKNINAWMSAQRQRRRCRRLRQRQASIHSEIRQRK